MKRSSVNYANFLESQDPSKNQIQQSSPSMCQSIAIGSMRVQNFLASTFQNGFQFNNQSPSSRSQIILPQPLNFYSLCMLLFPQNPKSVPCSVFVLDTLFYTTNNESKEIIYVFKDRRKNLLVKMKNKGKTAFDLFLKRRQNYEISKAKGDKISKSGFSNNHVVQKYLNLQNPINVEKKHVSQLKNDRFSLDEQIDNSQMFIHSQKQNDNKNNDNQVSCFQIIAGNIKNKYTLPQDQTQDDICQRQAEVINFNQDNFDDENERQDSKNFENMSDDFISLTSQKSVQDFKVKLTKLSFQNNYNKFIAEKAQKQQQNKKNGKYDTIVEEFPIITPSNSVRDSYHSLQTNYMSLLKYSNGQIIRLKFHDFKAIYQNPLYANEKFKNNNNTQYIQTLPVEDEFKDIKVFSLHFHYEIFKNQPLFLHVKNSLYKENQYMTGLNRNYFEQTDKHFNHHKFSKSKTSNSNENMSIERKNNLILKRKLKQESIEVYLYYQIFEIYTYASMHYNKQILNGIFRFIEYDKDFALFETENVVVKEMPKDAEFIRTKIFNEESKQKFDQGEMKSFKQTQNKNSPQKYLNENEPENDTFSQTIRKITTQMLKLSSEPKQQLSQVQQAIQTYFKQQNVKIQSEMSNYFNQKIQKIKNIKDMGLSKNIFKVINGIQDKKTNEQQSWSNFYKKNQQSTDFHEILNDDKKLEKFLKQKEKNDLYSRRNISNYSVVRCQKQVEKAMKNKKNNTQKANSMSPKNIEAYKNMFKTNFQLSNRPQTTKNVKFNCDILKQNLLSNQISIKSINTFEKTNRSLFSSEKDKKLHQESKKLLQNSQSLKTFGNSQQFLVIQRPMSSKFEKKLINERYTQFNKSNYKLNAFQTDKFI